MNFRQVKLLLIIAVTSALLVGCTETKTASITQVTSANYFLEPGAFSNSRMLVSNGKDGTAKRFGYINEKAELIIPLQSFIGDAFSEDTVRGMYDLGFYIFLDTAGNPMIESVDGHRITSADIFIDGYAVVELEDLPGSYVIDKSGEIHLAPTDQQLYYRNLGDGCFQQYNKNDESGTAQIVDINGTPIAADHVVILHLGINEGFYTYDELTYGLWSYEKGEKKTAPIFSQIGVFADGIAMVVHVDGSVQIIDTDGKCVINLSSEYKNIDSTALGAFADGLCALNFSDGSPSVIIDSKGHAIAETRFDSIAGFHEDTAVCQLGGLYGYVNADGKELVKPEYDFATNIAQGVGFLSRDRKVFRFTCD